MDATFETQEGLAVLKPAKNGRQSLGRLTPAQANRRKKKRKVQIVRIDAQKSRQRLADVAIQVAGDLDRERPTSRDAAEYFVDEEQHKQSAVGLYYRARSIPTDWGLDDYVQLLKANSGTYIPPWRRPIDPPRPKETSALILEPDVVTHLPRRVPGSCPCSPEPIYLHEVPDSEPEIL